MRSRATAALLVLGGITLAGCSRDTSLLEPAPFPSTAEVFTDNFAPGVDFQAFSGSKTDAILVDPSVAREGEAALAITVPNFGDASGSYAGGAFVASVPRDLSGFNALTFWIRGSSPATFDVAGLGNDNTGTSRFTAQRTAIPVTTGWTRVVIPIPDASRLDRERGLFFFAEGPENGTGRTVWVDDLRFDRVEFDEVEPIIPTQTLRAVVGQTVTVSGTTTRYVVAGDAFTVETSAEYFTFASSDPSVASVSETGAITVVGPGTTTITATLGGVAATGTVTLTVAPTPTEAPAAPTRDSADVISLFSESYPNRPVDTWSASFDNADEADIPVTGGTIKRYTNLGFAGVEFVSQQIDARSMTAIHFDVWVIDDEALRFKLVDFGPNGVFGGGDDTEHEITLGAGTNPAVVAGQWNSVDIPLSAFAGLTRRANLAQIIISGSSPTVFFDNIYFFRVPVPQAPTEAAPTPTRAAGDVISLFSDAYADRTVDTWSAPWDNANVEDVTIAGNAAKKYSDVVFAGIEFTSQPVGASAMTHIHIDLWTPAPIDPPVALGVILVDFGADRAFGGGDDTQGRVAFTTTSSPPLANGTWISLDIPLADFPGLANRTALAQMLFDGGLTDFFVDNVYFYRPGGNAPTTAAPTPAYAAGDVISLFSDAYSNRTVDTWSASWDQSDVEDVAIAGNAAKKYTNVVFTGIEFTSAPIDATSMTHFRIDLWTAAPIADPVAFGVILVDFGADGVFGGGDDTQGRVAFTATTSPALANGTWITLDIPLSQFAGLNGRTKIAQLVLDGGLSAYHIDNVLFHR